MVQLNGLALASLVATIEALIPDAPSPNIQRAVVVAPSSVQPTGIGGYVGLHREPVGDILGRRIDAKALISVRSAQEDDLNSFTAAIIAALLGQDRPPLSSQGILRLTLDNVGPVSQEGPVGGGLGAVRRDLSFNVLYEFLRPPVEAGGVIQEIPLSLHLNETGNSPRSQLRVSFQEGSLDWFEVVDDPLAVNLAPSLWRYNPAQERIEQRRGIRGGSAGEGNPNKPGTYLVLRATPAVPPLQDFLFKTQISSDNQHAIGAVFRWQDRDNFYFFLMESQRSYRMLGKKVAGAFQFLDTPGLDTSQGFTAGQRYDLTVEAVGPRLRVYLGNTLVLQGADASIEAPGRVGFACRANNQANFYSTSLVAL